LEPADLGDCFNAVRIIRVSGENQFDTIVQRMSAAVSVSQVHLKMNQKPVSPLCSGLAAVQMRTVSISIQSATTIVVRVLNG
jgi:hypothetical protein